ncbi:hypothetical protein PTSG_04207 [Salpingoeca rosetta]|uniref:COX assembly mitochondrial protein n=1 Tax=Salpingoeca rosetta (strain ATCC 50818 / BSB-021) TaxID=946362 RepID=F2U6W7_SALR5|nr:uncharacterized protein PTSG_04207 [Salpingoeca rosetta]EGD83599.1 hypothetical protein PTSG_04207 [Salpingoeca rosetta]|eukprot:XP_004995103.1 hypothetical protein PTSG_04207 [Salpingoeca rosetta]
MSNTAQRQEKQTAKAEALHACREAYEAVRQCHNKSTFSIFGSLCLDETKAFMRCYREHAGELKTRSMGVVVDWDRFLYDDEDNKDHTNSSSTNNSSQEEKHQ